MFLAGAVVHSNVKMPAILVLTLHKLKLLTSGPLWLLWPLTYCPHENQFKLPFKSTLSLLLDPSFGAQQTFTRETAWGWGWGVACRQSHSCYGWKLTIKKILELHQVSSRLHWLLRASTLGEGGGKLTQLNFQCLVISLPGIFERPNLVESTITCKQWEKK